MGTDSDDDTGHGSGGIAIVICIVILAGLELAVRTLNGYSRVVPQAPVVEKHEVRS